MDTAHANTIINGIYLVALKEANGLMNFWFMTFMNRNGSQIMICLSIRGLGLLTIYNLAQETDIQRVYSKIKCTYLGVERNKVH